MAVYTTTDRSAYAALAEELSDSRGERLVGDVSELDRGEPVLHVFHPRDTVAGELLALQKRQLREGASSSFGVVSARTPSSARALYEREPPAHGDHLILARQVDRPLRTEESGLTLLTRSDATPERFETLESSGLASLSAMTDGRTIHGYLSGGYLCGFPSSLSGLERDGHQPPCLTPDGRDCPLEGDLVVVDELEIPHVFYNSCSSIVPNSPTGIPVSAGQAFLEGAVSMIGGYRTMSGRPHEAALHHGLLRAGYSAAERCYLLNRNAHAIDLKSYPYVLYGRPSVTVHDPVEQRYETTVSRTDDGARVTATDVDAHVIDLEIEDTFGSDDLYVVNELERYSEAELFYSAFEEDDHVRLLVFSWGRFEAPELSFRIETQDVWEEDYRIIKRSRRNLRRLDDFGLVDRKVRNQLSNLRNRATGLSGAVDRVAFDANEHFDVRSRIDAIRTDLAAIEDRLRGTLADRDDSFISNDYGERVVAADVSRHDDDCHRCGRPVFTKTTGTTFNDAKRTIGVCPRCAKQFDVPADGASVNYPVVHDPSPVTERTTTLDVSFTNPKRGPVRAVFYPWLKRDVEEGGDHQYFDPEVTRTTLAPGERRTVTFELDASTLNNEVYTVNAYVIGNLDIYVGRSRLLVDL